jgi:hypothetical protein
LHSPWSLAHPLHSHDAVCPGADTSRPKRAPVLPR